MRFNELIAGVRGDIAVKLFGDDFGGMNAAADRIAEILRRTHGAAAVRVEQTEGLPMLDIRPNRMAVSRIGVTAGDVQDTVATAPWLRAHGARSRGRRRGAEAAGDRRRRWPDLGYAADPVRPADALCTVRQVEGVGGSAISAP
jgi:hypothetical protein